MKRSAIILLITIYSLSTFGVNLKEFYCCGKLKSTTLAIVHVETSCSKGNESDGCCKTKYQYLKVKDKHVATAHIATPINFFTELHSPANFWQLSFPVPPQVNVINGSHAPPLFRSVPIYISSRVFRI